MITVRVFLECLACSDLPRAHFDTFVALRQSEFQAGGHIAIAERRAAILGFTGPYRVAEVRRLGLLAIEHSVGGTFLARRSFR